MVAAGLADAVRLGLALGLALMGLPAAASFVGGGPAAAQGLLQPLAGHWQGGGLNLRLDPARLQANTDPDKPFERQPLLIRNITGAMFLFDIGRERFIALVQGETMSLTTARSPRTLVLRRVPWDAPPSLAPASPPQEESPADRAAAEGAEPGGDEP
jgi:hypothetical protein